MSHAVTWLGSICLCSTIHQIRMSCFGDYVLNTYKLTNIASLLSIDFIPVDKTVIIKENNGRGSTMYKIGPLTSLKEALNVDICVR